MVVQSIPEYAAAALALSVPDWTCLGVGEETAPTGDLDALSERVTALLLIRFVAVVARPYTFSDLSTTTICRTALMRQEPWAEPVNDVVIAQLRQFVYAILSQYNDVPYHSREHAFHVILSTNKLMDLMLQEKKTQTFGLRHDPLILFALIFSALVHDVDHLGIPNRQLAVEGHEVAVLYNDQSIAENRSLHIGFSELLKKDYKDLCRCLFQTQGNQSVIESESYQRFRKQVVQLVLNTDIASPERTQLAKTKWKEAFGNEVKKASEHSAEPEPVECSDSSSSSSGSESFGEVVAEPTIEEAENEDSSSHLEDNMNGVKESNDPTGVGVSAENPIKVTKESVGNDNTGAETSVGSDHGATEAHEGNEHALAEVSTDNDPTVSEVSLTESPILQEQPRFRRPLRNSLGSPPLVPSPRRVRRAARRPNSMYGRPSSPQEGRRGSVDSRRGSVDSRRGSVDSRRGSVDSRRSSGDSRRSSVDSRRSYGSSRPRSFRKRLGIRMSMDLTGEALQAYSSSLGGGSSHNSDTMEEPDELKASVILELILTAADVAHNLQGWPQMVKWSNRLYMELQRAFLMQRGSDPQNRWYENQIGFLDFYLLPLANRLAETGVFGLSGSKIFAAAVSGNKEEWLKQGMKVTESIIARGEKTRAVVQMTAAKEDSTSEESMNDAMKKSTNVVEDSNGVRAVLVETRAADKSFDNRPSWIAAISIMVIAIVVGVGLQVAHVRSSLPIRRGQVVPPGTWLSKCGFFGFLTPSCESSYLNVGADGFVTLFDSDHNVVWEMRGGTCEDAEASCIEGLKFMDDWRIQVGGKRIDRVDVFVEPNLAPWPFAYQPKVRTQHLTK